MKTLAFALFFLISGKVLAITPEEMKNISAKYCDLKVEEACTHLKCIKNPADCPKLDENSQNAKQIKADFEKAEKGCGEKDLACRSKNMQKIAEQRIKDSAGEIQKQRDDCKSGNQKSCWSMEIYDYTMKVFDYSKKLKNPAD